MGRKHKEISQDGNSEAEEDNIFLVEEIIGKKIVDGTTFYRVKWQNFPKSNATWEPMTNLTSCPEVVDEYEGALKLKSEWKKSQEK